MKKLAVYSVVMALFLALSCSKDAPDRAILEKTVRAYNTALIQTYHDADLNYMQPFASQDEINKLFPAVQILRATNNKMVAIQNEYNLLNVRQKEEEATVETKERWTYWWEDLDTGAVTKGKEVNNYQIRYHLRKVGGRWIVDRLESTKEKQSP